MISEFHICIKNLIYTSNSQLECIWDYVSFFYWDLRLCFFFLLRYETMFLFFLLRHETMVFFVYLDLRLCFFFFLLRLWYYFVVLRLCYYFTDPPGAPTIEGYSDSDHVVEERAARMTCKSVGGNPTATLRWFKGKGDQPGGQWPTALPCYPATERNTIVF